MPVSVGRVRAPHLVFLVALVAAGCPSTPTAPEPQKVSPPKVAASVRYQLGGPLRGPVAPGSVPTRDAEKPGKTLALTVRVVALAAPPTGFDVSLVSSQARLVVFQDDSGSALHATPHALVDARAGLVNGTADKVALALEQDGAARGRAIALLRGCVVSGATTAIDVLRDEPPALGEPSRRERATLLLGRPADGKEVDAAIEVELGAAPELVLLAGSIYPVKGDSSLLAVVPSPFQGEEAGWLAFCVSVGPGPSGPVPGASRHEALVAAAVRDLTAQAETAALNVAPVPPASPLPDIGATRRAMIDRAKSRQALFALAVATGAKTAEAIAVLSEDQTVATIASLLSAKLAQIPSTGKSAEMGIALEHAVLDLCKTALVTDPVPEDLPDTLEWRGGAALRLLANLAPELEHAKTLDELERAIEEQNVKLLLDASPTVRARAARWLSQRISLEGYSALAPSAERRAAVEKIRNKRAEAPRGSR
jgi:hypothetical protein